MEKIEKKLRRKENPELVRTIILLKKNKEWKPLARFLSRVKRKQIKKNLEEINKNSAQGDNIVVPGKVLGKGKLEKKIRIIAFSFSEKAREEIKKSGSETRTIQEEINKNPKAEGVKVLK